MAKISGSEIMARTLVDFGVNVMFTLHSGNFDGLFQTARDHGMTIIHHRHEQAAGFAAAGYARCTGKTAVVPVCCGGGVTNVITPVANAWTDCIPMVVLGGQNTQYELGASGCNAIGEGADNTQIDMMKPITKWAVRVPCITRLADVLGRAIRMSMTGRPGPVYVEIPVDVEFGMVEESEVFWLDGKTPIERPAPSAAAVDFILEKIREAKRPVIIVGSGAAQSRCEAALTSFAELINIPVLTNNLGRFMLGNHFLNGRVSNIGAAKHKGFGPDLVIMLGARFDNYTGALRGNMITEEMYAIQIDVMASEFGRNREPDYAVVADCNEAMKALLKGAENKDMPNFIGWATMMHDITVAAYEKGMKMTGGENGPISANDLASIAMKTLPEDSVIVIDGGEVPGFMDGVISVKSHAHYLPHGHIGNLGEGMPHAIGAALANPGKQVVVFGGDGSTGFNFMEFDTMVRFGLPIIVIVFNNGAWGMSAHMQDILFGEGKRVVVDLGEVHYEKAAEGLGCHAEFVTRRDEIAPAIERALASGKPACINVITDLEYCPKITYRFASQKAYEPNEEGKVYVPISDEQWV